MRLAICITALLLLSTQLAAAKLLMWGLCIQDQGKCGTCLKSGCSCTEGTAWTGESCMLGICMRCWQYDDGSTESQVGSLGTSDCPTSQSDMATACSSNAVTYESVYEAGNKCIDFGTGRSLNCLAAANGHQAAALEGATDAPTTAGELPTSEAVGSVSSGSTFWTPAVIAGVAIGCAAAVAIIVLAAVFIYKRTSADKVRPITISSPLKSKHGSQTAATLESAVNDLM